MKKNTWTFGLCIIAAILFFGLLYGGFAPLDNDDTWEFPPAVHFRGSLWIGTDNTAASISLSAAVGLANTVDDMEIVGEIESYTPGRPTIDNQANDNLVGYSIYMSDSIPNYIFVKYKEDYMPYGRIEE